MQTEIAWIIDALAHNRKKTKSGLAAALGIDPSAVTRLLHGERRLKFSEARLAANYLEVEPPKTFGEGGFAEEGEAFAHAPAESDPSFAPLYRASAGEEGFWRLDRSHIIERKPRAPQLSGVRSAFGFYVPDEVMSPRFKIGEIAWINPVRPVAPGDDAMLLFTAEENGGDRIFPCEILEIQDKQFVVRQYGNGEQRLFSRDEWVALHVFGRA